MGNTDQRSGGSLFLNELRILHPDFAAIHESSNNPGLPDAWHAAAMQMRMTTGQLATKIAEAKGLQLASGTDQVDQLLLAQLPYTFSSSRLLLPLRREGNLVVVADANPFDDEEEQLLHFIYGSFIRRDLAPADTLEIAIAKAYADLNKVHREAKLENKKKVLEEKEIPRLAKQMLAQAAGMHASDLHIQPFVGGSAVRARVDGLLKRLVILPENVSRSLIRYFQACCGMDPTNQLLPQDGSMSIELNGRHYDLRISTLPATGDGEKIVIRLLTSDRHYNLAASGLSLAEIHSLRRMAANPSGVVLLCGPTGSGKTTTLYSVLAELNKESVSITTIENPVEYRMPGLMQTEVNDKAGLTFARALRSILRQDPDVILIGEIRDDETAQIAMQAAMTGHLVFSTLHTNDALGAIPRLLDLNILPSILSQALVGLVSQRLLRRLCENCRHAASEPYTSEEIAFKEATGVTVPFRASGCEYCDFSGYSGRVVITEMVEITKALAAAIGNGVKNTDELLESLGSSMNSMSAAASRRIISGDTTPAEAMRVIGRHFWFELAKDYGREVPELGNISDSGDGDKTRKLSILLVGEPKNFSEKLCAALQNAWFSLEFANTTESAKNLLKENSEIELVIVDLPGKLNDQEIMSYVADYRVAMAWTRLPAILLLPEGRRDLQKLLAEEGATSPCLAKNTAPEDIMRFVNAALSRHVDYRWTPAAK